MGFTGFSKGLSLNLCYSSSVTPAMLLYLPILSSSINCPSCAKNALGGLGAVLFHIDFIHFEKSYILSNICSFSLQLICCDW